MDADGKIHRDTYTSLCSSFDEESSVRRICEAKLELSSTDLYSSLVSSLKEGLLAVNKSEFSKIICLGLGKIA
ncbi:hypothetical protein JTB14_002392 [Gonioctena quinquepunctata]|nr:hypothetical protein JTB14_002392 [Gonioctena quinquepunctata]